MDKVNILKTVYFVRHGESEGNAAGIIQPATSPLSELGVEQAYKIAERASKLDFDVIIASPYERTKQTAEIISKRLNKDIIFSELFVERVRPSSISGKSLSDVSAQKVFKKWLESLMKPNKRVEDGENYDDILRRVDDALQFLEERAEDKILVVTHGFFLRSLVIRILLGKHISGTITEGIHNATRMANTGLTVCEFLERDEKPSWRLVIYNDHSHLAD